MKQKATDKELGELHALLAKSMKTALEASTEAQDLLNACIDGGEELPLAVEAFLERAASANPSLLTAIAKFLKDNNITAAVEDDENLSALEQRLKSKRKYSTDNIVPIKEESEFG